jgi:hypothetical protein
MVRSMRRAGTSVLFALLMLPVIASAQGEAPQPQVRINTETDAPVRRDFLVAPTRTVITMERGESRTIDMQLISRQGERATFDFATEDFIADPENDGLPSFFTDNLDGPFPARAWLKPEVKTLTLEHGQRAFIRLRITVPPDAEPGDHQAAVIVTRRGTAQGQSGFAVVSRAASLFIVHVPGEVVKEGDIVGLSAQRKLNWWLPVNMKASFKNTGTMHMMPEGTIQIRNIFGITVDELPLKDWIVLRDSTRTRDLSWDPTFALGRYTATSDLTAFDGAQRLSPARTAFWVFPLLPVLFLLLAIFTVSFFVQYFFSRFELRRKQ